MTSPNLPELPFEPHASAFDAWVSALSANNPGEYLRSLNAALQAITTCVLPFNFQQYALEKLRPIVLIESHRLTQQFVGRPDSHDEKARKRVWLGIQFPGELGKAYLQLVKRRDELDAGDSQAALMNIHRALECFDFLSLRLAQVYEHCPSSFWNKVFELYAVAETLDQVDWTPSGKEDAHVSTVSIRSLLIRLMTMRLSTPNQLGSAQILKLHELLKSHVELIRLSKNSRANDKNPDFAFDLSSPGEPQPCNPEKATNTTSQHHFLYLGDFRKKLTLLSHQSVPESERLDDLLSAHLATRLGGLPNYQPENKNRDATLIIEFEDIVTRLSVLKAIAETPHSGQTVGMNLEILPIGQESATGAILQTSSKSAGTFQPGSGTSGNRTAAWNLQRGEYPCRVKRADTPGYYLLEATGITAPPGSLVAINTDNKLIQLGITGTRPPQGTDKQVPFELLANEPAAVNFYLDAAPTIAQRAMLGKLLAGTGDAYGLFVKSQRFRCGDRFTIDRNGRRQRALITKVRIWTPQFGVFEVKLESF